MLTKLSIRNFKRFVGVEIDLGQNVVFIGPNNSGKTTALQALALWDIGVKRWNEKRKGKTTPEKRPGVTINRRDLVSLPVPDANLLWRDLHVRNVEHVDGKQQTRNIRVDIVVDGVTNGHAWTCGLEFDYANEESFYCRPLRVANVENPARMPVPDEAVTIRVAFLPPMSGLAANETRLDPGAINVRLGEGRTAEVLRNLCYRIATSSSREGWARITDQIQRLFGVSLEDPRYIAERGEIAMTYRDQHDIRLDLSSTGRGLQQTLLVLAHLTANPGSVLLIDEPDAHLEILRQRQIYEVLTGSAQELRSQVIAASHSEVVLNEAADRDVVVAFVGRPHRIDDRGSQLLKALKDIGFEHYYQAEITGWVLYLEGASDLATLRSFAAGLGHAASQLLERPFVHYIENQPQKAREHFRGLRESKPDLVGFTLCDRIDRELQSTVELREYKWERREIENYLCQPETLIAWAEASAAAEGVGPLFEESERERRREAMKTGIADLVPPVALRDRSDRWWLDTKMSDEFLDRLFQAFFSRLALPNLMRKMDYHVLARHVPVSMISPEIGKVLDAIVSTASKAKPVSEEEE